MAPNQQPSREEVELAAKMKELDIKLKQLKEELERVNKVMVELSKAELALSNVKEGDELLVPIGSNVLGKVKLVADTFLIPVGAGYYVEVEKDKAVEEVKRSISQTKEYSLKLGEMTKNMEREFVQLLKKARQYL